MGDSSLASGFKTGLGSAVLQFTLERFATIGSLAWKEISVIWGVEDELRKLQRTFLKVEDLVDRVESSKLRFSNASKAWQIWYGDLKKLAYDADALLDHISLHISTYSRTKLHSVTAYEEADHQVRDMILSSFQLDLPHEISKMQKNLQDLANEMESLMLIEKVDLNFLKERSQYSSASTYVNVTSLLVDEGAIVGRQNDKANIIKLLGEPGDDIVSVIPLVGMGGVGKTTLARLVYNDKDVCEDFELKIWISVSMDLDVMKITKEVIESVTKNSCTLTYFNSLQLMLQEILVSSNKKFLLVLDDYWSENDDEWELLFSLFRSGCRGSKIIVTTRSIRVSRIVGSVEAYNLQTLSDDDCWSLMKHIAFYKKEVNEDFEPLGRDIAKKCKGLPLAARTIGGVLHRWTTEGEWHSILKSELWDLAQDQNGIYPSLMLSYLHLPPNLQKCFAYCSIFPQNHEFDVEDLVLLWMAEGFIQPTGEMRLEDIGKGYFNDLHLRSFFLLGKSSSNQTIYKMHDLILDLARLVSADTCAQVKHDTYPLFGNVCHLSLHHNYVQSLELKAAHKNKRLRTFLLMSKNGVARGLIDQKLFSNLKFLRTLALTNIGLSELPDSIEHLIYLRYFNISGNAIHRLPKSICKLLALQTLKLLKNPDLSSMPRGMTNLSNLRHLYFDINGKLSYLPLEFENLTNLQTLSAFFVNKLKNREGTTNIHILANMNSLRGSLTIKNLDNVSIETDARNAKLDEKPYLNELCLLWEELRDGLDSRVQDRITKQQDLVLTNLRPHKNLKELTIKNYSGIRCPSWLSDSRCKFTRIHLHGLNYCKILPSFGQLPLLKSLCIGEMNMLESIDHNFYGAANSAMNFPLLEFLELYQMTELVDWLDPASNIVSMPNLTIFKLDDCPKLSSLPLNLRSLSNSNINGCPMLP